MECVRALAKQGVLEIVKEEELQEGLQFYDEYVMMMNCDSVSGVGNSVEAISNSN